MGQIIYNALAWFLGFIKVLVGWLLDGVFYTCKGMLWIFMQGVFSTVSGFVSLISFSEVVFQWGAAYANLSSHAQYVLVAIGFPEFVTMIAGAYLIRFTLNLIPSWVTRA